MVDFVRGQQGINFFIGRSIMNYLIILARSVSLKLKILLHRFPLHLGFVDYLWIIVMFLSAVWILTLTAPIHIDVMLHFSKSVPLKKQTYLYLEWPKGEYILSIFKFLSKWFL